MLPRCASRTSESPMVGLGLVHWLGQVYTYLKIYASPLRVQVLVGSVGSGIVVKTGVNK